MSFPVRTSSLLVLVRVIAAQQGMTLSDTDMAWQQQTGRDNSVSSTPGPVSCTIGDSSTMGSALRCIEVSSTSSEEVSRRRLYQFRLSLPIRRPAMRLHGGRGVELVEVNKMMASEKDPGHHKALFCCHLRWPDFPSR